MTADIQVRSCTAADWPALAAALDSAFSSEMSPEVRKGFEALLDPARLLVATERDAVVGTAGIFSFEMTVPGNTLPTAGITIVGVRPSHRRRGILRQLMRRLLDDAHDRGEPLAILWATEPAIYQRFGFGIGTLVTRMQMDRRGFALLSDPKPIGRTRMLSKDEALALLPDVYERARTTIPGSLRRTADWWKLRLLNDAPSLREGGGPMFTVVLEIDGRPEGYVRYRVYRGWGQDGLPNHALDVLEAIGTSPVATREVWRFIFGVDLIAQVRSRRLCLDHPLFLSLADLRQLRTRLTDGIWVRIVDLPAALSARRYNLTGTLTFDLSDEFCAWNEGVWQLDVTSEGASVDRTEVAPELRLGVAELSAMCLGGVACTSLLRAGRLEELVPGTAHRADLLFRSDVPPWCLDDF